MPHESVEKPLRIRFSGASFYTFLVVLRRAPLLQEVQHVLDGEVGLRLREAGYTGAVKPPVRRTGNRKSGPEETGIYAAEPPSRRNSFPGWGRQLIGYIIRSVPDPVRIPLSWSGSWQDRSERC